MDAALYLTVITASYLFGNVNFAVLYSKMLGKDIRKLGSGNPGTMNMIRNYGKIMGAVTLISDVLKGALPCLLGWFMIGDNFKFSSDRTGLYVGALSLIVGHIYPVFYKFKGGKGIASSIGICAVINLPAAFICFALGFLFIQLTSCGTVGSFICVGAPLTVEAYLIKNPSVAVSVIMCALLFLTLFAHRKNIVRLFQNTDNKTKLYGKR